MEAYTILGGSGFIGSNLAQVLGNPFCPPRAQLYSIDDRNLGHVFYCLGDDSGEIESNLGYLLWFLKSCSFDSLTYLSSTRLYLGAKDGDEEAKLVASPHDLFNATKLAAEAACLTDERCTVARLSTVVGLNDGNYLIPGLIRTALRDGVMSLKLSRNFKRDLITIDDVVSILPSLRMGKYRIYNVAAHSYTMKEIVSVIATETGAKAQWAAQWALSQFTDDRRFPEIDITSIQLEFGFDPSPALPALRALCKQFKDIYVDQVLA